MKLILLLITLLLTPLVSAEIFKWTDDNGKVHFGDRKPLNKQVEEVTVKVNSYTNVTFELAPLQPSSIKKKKNVIMYATSWCGYCKKAREYFKANHIHYTEYDIETSEKGKRQYQKLNGKGVPVILVGESRMNGFSEQGFQRIYKD